LRPLVVSYFVGFLIIILYFGAISVVFYKNRNLSNKYIACFGISLFFGGFLPIMITQGPILEIRNMDQDYIN
jgi:hypothetical protein